MKLKCLINKCVYNNNSICQNVYLYVNCFQLSQWEADNIIANYLVNLKDSKKVKDSEQISLK